MNTDTGEIKKWDKVPLDERYKSIPITEGEEVVLKGMVWKIVRVKTLRKEIHLSYLRKADATISHYSGLNPGACGNDDAKR